MSSKTGIEWTDSTWNPVRGCTRVSEGCRNCYAERVAATYSRPGQAYHSFATFNGRAPRWTGEVRLIPSMLEQPLKWKRGRRIFVNSMSDLFHESLGDEDILRIFQVMRQATQHTFQVLTKRPERMRDFMRRLGQEDGVLFLDHLMGGMRPALDHVWLGVSAENQATADERIPLLLETPSAVRFVSAEPLLGPLELRASWIPGGDMSSSLYVASNVWGLDWLIVGGESGPAARPMRPEWARGIREQCVAAGVAFFFKQWGEWRCGPVMHHHQGAYLDITDYGQIPTRVGRLDAEGRYGGVRVGRARAGRVLDGRTWDEFPAGWPYEPHENAVHREKP